MMLLGLTDLLNWRKQLSAMGSGFGYHVNVSKSSLVIKNDCYDIACHLFAGASLTTKGRPYLGTPLVLLNLYMLLFKTRCVCGPETF